MMDTATENVAEGTGVENTSDENTTVENTSTNETTTENVNLGKDGLIETVESIKKSVPREQLEKQTISLKKDGKIQEMPILEAQKLINKDLPNAQQTIADLNANMSKMQQEYKQQLFDTQKHYQERFNEYNKALQSRNDEKARELYRQFNKNLEDQQQKQNSNEEAMLLRNQLAESEFRNFLRRENIDENNFFAKRIDENIKLHYDNPEIYNDYATAIDQGYKDLIRFTVESAEHLPLPQQETMVKSLVPKMSEAKQLELIGGVDGLKKLTAHYRESNASTVQKKETTNKTNKPEPRNQDSGEIDFFKTLI